MKNKNPNLKLRYNIVTTLVYLIGIILLVQLFNLQIIKGKEYRETSNTRLTRESVLQAARGSIKDRSGIELAGNKTGYNLELYKSKIDTNTLNETILKMVNELEKNQDTYVDNFPIAVEPFSFKIDTEEKQVKWKRANKIEENATAEECFEFFKKKYKIQNDNVQDIRKIITIRYQISQEGYSSTKSITISTDISEKSTHIFAEQNDEFPGIATVIQPIRTYPKGSLAGHILGYVAKISTQELEVEKDNGYDQNDMYGRSGIELVAEKYLRGTDGIKQIDMAVDGTVTGEYISKEAIAGADVVLTIDANLQAVTEEALKKNIEKIASGGFSETYDTKSGGMVVMNVKTGEVLAMASYPSIEPSKFIGGISQADWDYYRDEDNTKGKPLINKAVAGTYPPGSIFKMVTAIAGLETGAINTSTKINDVGVYKGVPNTSPACWIWNSRHRGHGWLNVSQAIQHSCNYFFYEVGNRIGIDNLAKYSKYFGLGNKTGIELTEERAGRVNERKEGESWYPGNTLSASIGQLNNTFTPIQMAKYASMLANGGKKVNPTIIKSIQNQDGTEVSKEEIENYINEKFGIKPSEEEQVTINEANLKAILEGMRSVTSDTGGTAYSIFKNFSIEVGGKTGSAEIGVKGDNRAHGWFLGFAPFDEPEIAVVIVIDNAGHGSYTAEAARDVIAQYFGMNSNQVQEDVTARPYTEMSR